MPSNLKFILFLMNNNKTIMETTWSPILQCAEDGVQLTSGNFTHVSNKDIVKVGTLVLWERILLSNQKLLPSKIGNAAPKVRIFRELIILSACWVNGSASRFNMLKPTNATGRQKELRTVTREEISVTSSDSEIENPMIGDLDLTTDSEFSD